MNKSSVVRFIRKLFTPKPDPKFHFFRPAMWGDAFSPEPRKSGKIKGNGFRVGLNAGDYVLKEFEGYRVYKILKINYQNDPTDMFFFTCRQVVGSRELARIKPQLDKLMKDNVSADKWERLNA